MVMIEQTVPTNRYLPRPDQPYFNRELSWVAFNARVLEEAQDPRNPLLERCKFVAIFSSNLDEFFMIRVSGIREQIEAGVQQLSPDGMTPIEQYRAVREAIVPLLADKRQLVHDELLPALASEGIHICNYEQLDAAARDAMQTYFTDHIFPVLTPLASDTSRPFPHISNLSLNLAVVLKDDNHTQLFARVKIPTEVLPRLVPVPRDNANGLHRQHTFVWVEQVILAHLSYLFPGMQIIAAYPFRVIRDTDIEIEEDEAADLLTTIEQNVRQRRFGKVVTVFVDTTMPDFVRQWLMDNMALTPDDIYTVEGALGYGALMSLMGLDRPDLKDPLFTAQTPTMLRGKQDLFEVIRKQDILLHHPYDSFSPVTDLIETAARDPDVLAIKQTLYRVGRNSPIVKALLAARENNKQVTVLVELKARFDEENNITWAKALEREGVHVVYGLLGLKTHAKIALVVRQEGDSIQRYVHLGTGNYNASTARLYTDLGLLTNNTAIGEDVTELFNYLTGYSHQRDYRKLLVAPFTLRQRILQMIEREIQQHSEHGNGHLIFKMNSLIDPEMIDALYRASQAGVRVACIIRGMCRLRPGIPNLSDNIEVRSIIGRFLEHHRIYYFHNGGQEEVYMGSADLMERNLDRRVETVFPIEDANLRRFVRHHLLETYLTDNVRTRILQPDGTYIRLSPEAGQPVVDSQTAEMGYSQRIIEE